MILSFFPAFYLIMWLTASPNNFEKNAILKNDSWFSTDVSKLSSMKYTWNYAFSDMTFSMFTNISALIVIDLIKCSLYCIYMIFWLFLGTKTHPKDNFCLHESIFQWHIKLFSSRSEFWQIRRKTVLIFSKLLFFQNPLVMS